MATADLFNFRDFEFVHGIFKLPKDIYLFRATHPTREPPSTEPTFFGDYEVASFYKMQEGRILKAFKPKHELRVLDMRYIQAIIPHIWASVNPSQTELRIITSASLVLGLITFKKQIELLESLDVPMIAPLIERMREFADLPHKPSWVHPIEIQGVRVGITDVDYFVMGFLKELFGHLVDGIIAPAVPSPYHMQIHRDISKSMLYQELIIFDRSKSLDEVVTNSLSLDYRGTIDAGDYIRNLMRVATPETSVTRRISLIQHGGKTKTPHTDLTPVRDETAERMSAGDIKIIKAYEKFIKSAKTLAAKLKKTQTYLRYYCPNFCVIASPIPGTLRWDP